MKKKYNDSSTGWFKGLDRKSKAAPLFRQIKRQIADAVSNGCFLPGDTFPSEVELVKITGVTRITVRQATNELVAEGVLIREKGKRPRVAMPKEVKNFLELAGISKYIDHDYNGYSCKVICSEYEKATAKISQALKIRKNSLVFVLERLRANERGVFGWEKTWMNKKLFPEIHKYDFSTKSLYHVLKNDYRIIPSYSEGIIDVLVADSAYAGLFKVKQGVPLLSVHRTVYTKEDIAIQVNHEIYRADSYSFAFKVNSRQ